MIGAPATEESEEPTPSEPGSEILEDHLPVISSSDVTQNDEQPEAEIETPPERQFPPKRPKRLTRRLPAKYDNNKAYAVTSHQESLNEPSTFKQATESPEAETWRTAMQKE